MREELERAYERLAAWCRGRDYAGHDPFDALNSRLFRATPLARSRAARLAWTQLLKRSPVNLRTLALVPAGHNPKGTALFALAALSRFRTHRRAEDAAEARALLDRLLEARIRWPAGGAAWGYNFDWQGRAFYAPRGTPAVVPTAFAVRALAEGWEAFGGAGTGQTREAAGGGASAGAANRAEATRYAEAAGDACEFILRGLNRSAGGRDELCFSYTPLDRTRVFNASLLAAESLAATAPLAGRAELLDVAARAARYVLRRQRADGSWAYGEEGFQSWADNFHTAFILTSLARVRRGLLAASPAGAHPFADEIERAARRGFEFWRDNFFLADGWPKYYPGRKYPADAHSAAACIVACAELRGLEPGALELGRRVAGWALRELWDRRGFFYYQRRRLYTARTPYMRWSEAWMLYALARLLEAGAAYGVDA